jgi:hypothetical protein
MASDLLIFEVHYKGSFNRENRCTYVGGFVYNHSVHEVHKMSFLNIEEICKDYGYTYLGLPALVGKSRTKAFKCVIDKVWKRLQDYKLKLLSQARQEILLKAVVQAILTYCMSVFMLLKSLCSKINSLMQRFW